MERAFYSDSIANFLDRSTDEILGILVQGVGTYGAHIESAQTEAWVVQIRILKSALTNLGYKGSLLFEYSIPRLGRRIDVLALIDAVIFIIEFKVGESEFTASSLDQVCDYALDLKNFHETSHSAPIAPIVIATAAENVNVTIEYTRHRDNVMLPIKATPQSLGQVLRRIVAITSGLPIDRANWESGRYRPTPTIVEAALALYGGHKVEEISKRDAEAQNLAVTSKAVEEIIRFSKASSCKSICFVTGVPGAGKTLVGLDIATKHFDKHSELYSVYLSGNAPLVAVLREALAQDRVRREKEMGIRISIGNARSEVNAFIQNVHHFRNEYVIDATAPVEHVAVFDEAQRAWDQRQTARFMKQRGLKNFTMSEPEFLISCLNRHTDWAVVVCLIGGGQEINTGEAGITGWLNAISRSFPDWRLFISSQLSDSEYEASEMINRCCSLPTATICDELHLETSMRSFRAENLSLLVNQLLDLKPESAATSLNSLRDRYPIFLTRDIAIAKDWLRSMARGTERYGLIASSYAYRLKPYAIDVRMQVDPVQWFLFGKNDVRSSFYLEDAATEFRVQGLELDWACVTWDADFRRSRNGWDHWKFAGSRWNRVRKAERQKYLKNAYRVLLTRARQGMVIFVPEGDPSDATRNPEFYDATFAYLKGIGFSTI